MWECQSRIEGTCCGSSRSLGTSETDEREGDGRLTRGCRQGHDLSVVARAPTPKKKIRGWGPKVQNGIRIR